MSRRASLPGAAELFRTTSGDAASTPAALSVPEGDDAATTAAPSATAPHPGVGAVPPVHELSAAPADVDTPRAAAGTRAVRATRRMRSVGDRLPTGRERHEEKITVYCSAEELLDLESARLQLRAEHGMAVDRGRIVREALAVVLADLEAKGESSILVRRLRES